MKEFMLFTDGSADPQSKIGYGAYLVVPGFDLPLDILKGLVKLKRFENTSSTKLELQTLLWAMRDLLVMDRKLKIYSDSLNILGLPGRRMRLEQNNYLSKASKPIINADLYREFYKLTDHLDCKIIKVHGHKLSRKKDDVDRLFTLVDRASRKALRQDAR